MVGVKEWPPGDDKLIHEFQMRDGRLLLWATPSCQIVVELVLEHDEYVHPGDTCWTCPIIAQPEAAFVIAVSWKDKKIHTVHLNGCICYSRDNPNLAPRSLVVRQTFGGEADKRRHDFSAENERARIERGKALHGLGSSPKRIDGGKKYAFDSLADEIGQLRDLIADVERGKEYHVPGIAARVRLLTHGKPMGLLQRCAAYHERPLILYTAGNPYIGEQSAAVLKEASFHLRQSGIPTPNFLCSNPIDLDVWLSLPALSVASKDYSNLDVIKEIGDTIGAHRDIAITSAIASLMRRPSLIGSKYNDVTRYALSFGRICLALAEKVSVG